jgi:branched-chain amino acid transport system ATP-binding protein
MLELRGVTAGYGSHTVLRDVDLVVPDNSVVALLGPNGAGKTTLLRVASGLLRPSAGRLLLDSRDVTGWPTHRLAAGGVCHVPEGRGIFRALSVKDNIRLQANPALDLEPVSAVVSAFPRLGERLAQRAGTMSGGEQQMLALAHAYVAGSKTVLLDEVSMGLAPKLVDTIFAFLEDLARSGVSLLVVEQYVAKALGIADYVCLLDRGRTAFVGEPAELDSAGLAAHYLAG